MAASKKRYRYVYGPVSSWRLGSSLGVDPLSVRLKVCSFDCGYCQIGKTKILSKKRKVFVKSDSILKEIGSLPPLHIDYITFSGTGEPTLAKNLGAIIRGIRAIRKERIAVITNSTLIDRKDVQNDLLLADFVLFKLDATAEIFKRINRPVRGVRFESIIKGIKEFSGRFKGKVALQIMFTKDNKSYAADIASIARDIDPDEVQINTPLRPGNGKPISKTKINMIKQCFKGMRLVSVYGPKKKKAKPISIGSTLKRRAALLKGKAVNA